MTTGTLLLLALIGLLVTGLAATGAKVLHHFSRRRLEVYCRRQRRDERFDEILDWHDEAALGAEGLQIAGTTLLLLSAGLVLHELLILGWAPMLLAVLAAVILLLAATSWIPWAVVRLWSAPFLFHSWRFWQAIGWLFWPLSRGADLFDTLMHRLSGRPEQEPDEQEEAFEDEIRTIVSTGLREGFLEADAGDMIEGVIMLGDADVSDIMTPRSEMDALRVDLDWPELLQFVIRAGRTRIPVYGQNLDDVLGVFIWPSPWTSTTVWPAW